MTSDWPLAWRGQPKSTPSAFGPEHPHVARLNNLALLHHDQGRCGEARPLYERALAIREKGLGPEHPRTNETRATLQVLGQSDA